MESSETSRQRRAEPETEVGQVRWGCQCLSRETDVGGISSLLCRLLVLVIRRVRDVRLMTRSPSLLKQRERVVVDDGRWIAVLADQRDAVGRRRHAGASALTALH